MELFKVKDFFTDISMLEGVGGGGSKLMTLPYKHL